MPSTSKEKNVKGQQQQQMPSHKNFGATSQSVVPVAEKASFVLQLGKSKPPGSGYNSRSHRRQLELYYPQIQQWYSSGSTILVMIERLKVISQGRCAPSSSLIGTSNASRNQLWMQMRDWGLKRSKPRRNQPESSTDSFSEIELKAARCDPALLVKHTKAIYSALGQFAIYHVEFANLDISEIKGAWTLAYFHARQDLIQGIQFYLTHGLIWTTLLNAVSYMFRSDLWFVPFEKAHLHLDMCRRLLGAGLDRWNEYTVEDKMWIENRFEFSERPSSAADYTTAVQTLSNDALLDLEHFKTSVIPRLYGQPCHAFASEEIGAWLGVTTRTNWRDVRLPGRPRKMTASDKVVSTSISSSNRTSSKKTDP